MATDFIGIAVLIYVIMFVVAYVYYKTHEDSYNSGSSNYSHTEFYHMMKLDDMMHDHYDYTKPTISGQIDVHDYCHHDHHH